MMLPAPTVPEPQRVACITPGDLPADTLRVIVFGPGKGEAIIVQLPDGRVGVVDGCREPHDPRDPIGYGDPVREYLAVLAAQHSDGSSAFALEFVCLTHPHADHYAGLGRLIDAYRDRIQQIWTTISAQPRDLNSLRALAGTTTLQHKRGGSDPSDRDGLARFLDAFEQLRKTRRANLEHLSTDKTLLRAVLDGQPLRIDACGPASHDVEDAWATLREELLEQRNPSAKPPSFDPNQMSGALLITWGRARVLLGGDLLSGKHEHSGWHHAAQQLDHPIQVINIAHHGSAEAHHEPLWQRLQPLLAIVTPYQRAKNHQPPKPTDIERLCQNAIVAITSPPAWLADNNPAHPQAQPPWLAAPPLPGPLQAHPAPSLEDRNNAVAVSLTADGQITHLVLAGQAALYR